ncbi:MAG: flavin reductase family protein [bacterium]|nr:flavin reductase family protein [Candidatus Sumerlaeota bacterium]
MTNLFTEIDVESLEDNPFKLIGKEWMLITAGSRESFNTMTASWGGLGVLWNKRVAFIFIRPTRHTYLFAEKSKTFTLCFFDEKHREALNICGTCSGRDVDKIRMTGLTPAETPGGSICFAEARMVLECHKLYFSDIDPAQFINPDIDRNYPAKDYHRMHIGEIMRCLVKQSS